MEYVIRENDMEFLKWAYKRLYSENRMTGDDMRDMAQRIQLIYDNAEKIE